MTTHPGTTAAAYLDEAMKAIALAKQALLGGADAALFLSSGPDLAAAEASPGNPYGSTKHGRYDAASEPALCQSVVPSVMGGLPYICNRPAGHGGWHKSEHPGGQWRDQPDAASAAEVAEGVDTCPVCESASRQMRRGYGDEDGLHPCVDPWHGGAEPAEDACRDGMERDKPPHNWCWRAAGHPLPHRDAFGNEWDHLTPGFCPAQWGEPPETMLCSLSSGHDGNHATAEGIEQGGRWETAEPGAKDGA